MQYALIEVGNGKRVLMAANELAYLHRFGDGVPDAGVKCFFLVDIGNG